MTADQANSPTPIPANESVVMYQGAAALTRLDELLAAARAEDAVGLVWVLPSSFGPWKEAPFDLQAADVSLMEVVLIDSGNKHGDSWKFSYYPRSQVGLFLYET